MYGLPPVNRRHNRDRVYDGRAGVPERCPLPALSNLDRAGNGLHSQRDHADVAAAVRIGKSVDVRYSPMRSCRAAFKWSVAKL